MSDIKKSESRVVFRSFVLFSIIQAAGWPIWFLILTSIIAVALIIERFISLQRKKVMPKRLLEEVMELYKTRQVSPDLIQKLDASSPMGSIFANGLRLELASRDAMKASMEEAGALVAHRLEKYLPALGTIATVAPLMGLFGTAVGMIEIFGAQAPTGTNPQQLAYGISVALYNTGLGILVAIPAMIFYRYFRTKVDDYLVEMEQQSSKFIDMVKGPRK